MALTPFSPPPLSTDPTNFDARADNLYGVELPRFVTEVNALGTPGLGGGDMTGDLAPAPEINVASAATCNIGAAASNKVAITGTTTITSFGTAANRLKYGRFTGALTLTNNGTSLILPGGANITTAAGDTFMAMSDASGNWRVVDYQRASNPPDTVANFTPVFTTDVTPPTGVTYSGTATGRVYRRGPVADVFVDLRLTSKGAGGVGQVRITGLPAAAIAAFSGALTFASLEGINVTAGHVVTASVEAGTSIISFRVTTNTGASSPLDWANITNGFLVRLSGSYPVA